MQEKRGKGGGCAAVRDYILNKIHDPRLPAATFVRITGHEIAGALGISPQTANRHVRYLVRQGAIVRRRRHYFSEPSNVYFKRVSRWMEDQIEKFDWPGEFILPIDLRALAFETGMEIEEVKTQLVEWFRQHGEQDPGCFHFLNDPEDRPAPFPIDWGGTRKPGDGYEVVRDHVLDKIRNRRCREDLFVRFNCEEAGALLGLAPAAVRRYLRSLVDHGFLCRACDSPHYYALVSEVNREQLRAWIRHRLEKTAFAELPILRFNPVEAAESLLIPDFCVVDGMRELTNMDAAYNVCRMDDGEEDEP